MKKAPKSREALNHANPGLGSLFMSLRPSLSHDRGFPHHPSVNSIGSDMSSEWIKLTDRNTRTKIHVNMAMASSIYPSNDGKFTTIWFLAGHPDGKIEVLETPRTILGRVEKLFDA
jgi:hypothetical protein